MSNDKIQLPTGYPPKGPAMIRSVSIACNYAPRRANVPNYPHLTVSLPRNMPPLFSVTLPLDAREPGLTDFGKRAGRPDDVALVAPLLAALRALEPTADFIGANVSRFPAIPEVRLSEAWACHLSWFVGGTYIGASDEIPVAIEPDPVRAALCVARSRT